MKGFMKKQVRKERGGEGGDSTRSWGGENRGGSVPAQLTFTLINKGARRGPKKL